MVEIADLFEIEKICIRRIKANLPNSDNNNVDNKNEVVE